jgi:glutamyl/glutaminyl-tRNA synthetase
MLDFQGAVDDHLLGTTHVIRGKDLRDSAERQRYVYDALGWSYPEVLHWGRVAIEEYVTTPEDLPGTVVGKAVGAVAESDDDED